MIPPGPSGAPLRLLFLGNNRVGADALRWLVARGERVVGVVLHPAATRSHGEALMAAADLPESCVFDASRLRDPEVLDAIAALQPHMGVSALFGYLLRPDFLALFPRGVVNLHPSLLPWNRGAHPNVWSIVEATPSGVSLHYIDAGVDTGDVVAQREVPVLPHDTGRSLYRRLEEELVRLFVETWPAIAAGTAGRSPQPREAGSRHLARDLDKIDRIDLERRYTGRELIDLLRARTFPPYRGAYFEAGGRRVYLRLELETD